MILIGEPKIELYEGDCIEIMKSMPDNSVDCIITDPPYNVSKEGSNITRIYKHYNWQRQVDIKQDFGEWTDVGKPKKTFLILRNFGLQNA